MFNMYRSEKGFGIHTKHLRTACMDMKLWLDRLKGYLQKKTQWSRESMHCLSKNDRPMWLYLH